MGELHSADRSARGAEPTGGLVRKWLGLGQGLELGPW